jgi:hypothetical protein
VLPYQQAPKLFALGLVERRQQLVLDLVDHVSALGQGLPAGIGDVQRVSATVAGVRAALDQPLALEVVDRRDH